MLLFRELFMVSLYVLSTLDTICCHTYQTKALFLSFSELAALEAKSNSLDGTNSPGSHNNVKPFVLRCHPDSIEVVLRASVFDPALHVEPSHLRLGSVGATGGPLHCTAKTSENGDVTIRAPLTDCGGEVMFTQSSLLYNNLLLYSPSTSPGDTLQANGAAIPVQCEYKRRYSVSSGALKPTWSPVIYSQTTHLNLDFHLRLMTDDWSNERKSSVYFLGDTVNMEASVDHPHLPLRLFVKGCVATLTPELNSYPRYPFIDHHGCFTDSQLHASSSRFLPRVRDQVLHIQLQPFLFHQDNRHTIYITCHLEADPISNGDQVKKACSFVSGRWRSVDGDDRVCKGCSSAKSNHKRALRSNTWHRHTELNRETILGPITFLPWERTTVGKHKYLS